MMRKNEEANLEIQIEEHQVRDSHGRAGMDTNGNKNINKIATNDQDSTYTTFDRNPPANRSLSEKLWKITFFTHLVAITILIGFLTVRGFIGQDDNFQPKNWYIPLLASIACSVAAAIAWLLLTIQHPTKAVSISLWLAPLLTLGVGIVLSNIGNGIGLAFALVAVVSTLVQSLYSCWISSRLEHAGKILQAALLAVPSAHGTIKFVVLSTIHCFLFSGCWILGVSGVMAYPTRFSPLYISILLLSLLWTMQILKYIMYVSIAKIAYLHLTDCRIGIDAADAFHTTYKSLMGHICLGSILAPAIGAFRGLARTMNTVAGGNDEFLFSCASCYMAVADRLVTYGNRWGFVHVAVYQKEFIYASRDVWRGFMRADMERLVNTDLTSSFCFMCGVAGGMLCALVGGIWTIIIDRDYTAAVSIYAFLVGYFTIRVIMALPHACVSAYYVAYAEDTLNPRVNQIISQRIQELR